MQRLAQSCRLCLLACLLALLVALAVPAVAQQPGPFYHVTDLLTEPLKLGPPYAIAPDGPGPGVTLDEDQLQQYRDNSLTARSLGD